MGVRPIGALPDWQTGWHVYAGRFEFHVIYLLMSCNLTYPDCCAVEWFEDRLDFYLVSIVFGEIEFSNFDFSHYIYRE